VIVFIEIDEIKEGEIDGSCSTQGVREKGIKNVWWLRMKALRIRNNGRTRQLDL
jgi:hypothetical protein